MSAYGAHALDYADAGWSVFPLPKGAKTPPPPGRTGRDGRNASRNEIKREAVEHAHGNIAVRVADGLIGLDVDAYDDKPGAQTLANLVAELGELPVTYMTTSRDDGVSGIRFFRVPAGVEFITKLPGIEICQRHHRYAVVWPSVHPSGGVYQWRMSDGSPCDGIPDVNDLPELPAAWIERLRAEASRDGAKADLSRTERDALLAKWSDGEPCSHMRDVLDRYTKDDGNARHDRCVQAQLAIVRFGEAGHPGAGATLDDLKAWFGRELDSVRPWRQEWENGLTGAVEKVAADPTPDHEKGCRDGGTETATGRTIKLTRASEIAPKPVHWLWGEESLFGGQRVGRVPLGMMILLAGREGTGKSTVAYWMVAQVTRGTLPGYYFGSPKSVIVAAYEDSWAETIVPRLMAAGADLDRVYRVDVTTVDGAPGNMSLPSDVAALKGVIRDEDVALLLLDPMMSALSATLKGNDYQAVYQALLPIARLADETRCAVVGITHFNKTTGSDPMARVMGSTAFAGAVRGALVAHKVKKGEPVKLKGRDEGDPFEADGQLYLLGNEKNNVGPMMPTLVYGIIGRQVAGDGEDAVWGSTLDWHGETDESVNERMREEERPKKAAETVTDGAADWLRNRLADGKWHPKDKIAKAAENAGFALRTIERAAKEISIRSHRRVGQTALWTINADAEPPQK